MGGWVVRRAAAAAATVLLLVASLLAQLELSRPEGEVALRAALESEEVLRAYGRSVEPLLDGWLKPIVLVYLDAASPPEARVYVVEWMDPRALYLTSALKVYVRVAKE
ncbi:MAG: hypothetical protein QXT74_05080, partial [Candidatus Nezhaarchaeales archaeon]